MEGPLHGYALRTQIREGLGPLWQIASSQLYQVLHRLEEQGLVTRCEGEKAAGPSKTIYAVSDAGAKAFWDWAQQPIASMRTVRVEFAAKLYFLRRLRIESVSGLIDRQLEALPGMEAYVSSQTRGSDDAPLNDMWHAFQVATMRNFYRWLESQRANLCTPKEINE